MEYRNLGRSGLEDGETEVPDDIGADVASQWSEPAEEYRDAAEVRESREEEGAPAGGNMAG